MIFGLAFAHAPPTAQATQTQMEQSVIQLTTQETAQVDQIAMKQAQILIVVSGWPPVLATFEPTHSTVTIGTIRSDWPPDISALATASSGYHVKITPVQPLGAVSLHALVVQKSARFTLDPNDKPPEA